MIEDPRCCGTGTCIIDPEGRCWCGQQWDGEKMRHAPLAPLQEQDTGTRLVRRASLQRKGRPSERRLICIKESKRKGF